MPHLTPVEKCSDLPRQICSFGLQSPRVSEKPLVTKWCFDPTEEEQGEQEGEGEDYDNPPDLTPFQVEDVLVFSDEQEDSDVRRGKDIDVSGDVTNSIDGGSADPKLISSSLDDHQSSQTDFQEQNSETGEPLRNNLDNIDQTDFLEKSRNNKPIENIKEDYDDEGQELDEEINAILTKLNSDFRSKISVEKADGLDDDEDDIKKMTALAKIIKHKSTPGRHTILIKNTAEALRLFGIKNAPSPGNQNDSTEPTPSLDLDNSLIATTDLAFSDTEAEKLELQIRQAQNQNNSRGELDTNLIELENHPKLQMREESGINSVDNPSSSSHSGPRQSGKSQYIFVDFFPFLQLCKLQPVFTASS